MDTHFQNSFTVIGQYCYGQVPQHLKSHNAGFEIRSAQGSQSAHIPFWELSSPK